MEKFYDITVAGVKRRLPIVQISDQLAVASFVMLGDCEVVCAAAQALKDKVPEADWLVTDVLRAALAPIGIHLEDHLIFVDGDMLSLKNSEHRRNLSAV